MINNAFEDLLPQYIPVPQLSHYPPRLSFGFAIPNDFHAFRRVALKKKLRPRKVLLKVDDFISLQILVLDYLNKECDLPPKRGIRCNWILSKEALVVLELETNYEELMPPEKISEAIKIIKSVFGLPHDARPKWYLEDDVDLRDPHGFLFKGESLVSVFHKSGTEYLTTLAPQCTCSNGPSVSRLRNDRDRTVSYPILNAFYLSRPVSRLSSCILYQSDRPESSEPSWIGFRPRDPQSYLNEPYSLPTFGFLHPSEGLLALETGYEWWVHGRVFTPSMIPTPSGTVRMVLARKSLRF